MFLSKLFGDSADRLLKKNQSLLQTINNLEHKYEKFADEKFPAETEHLKKRLKKGETLDQVLPEAFALTREAAKRTIGQRHYDVQLLGGLVLHQGKIAEMRTGEGKTLVATLPAFLNALTGEGVHVVTVNDYLAKRDSEWMGSIFAFLGLTVACLQHESAYQFSPQVVEDTTDILAATSEWKNLKPISRQEAYKADILYGTNHEFGFDYLRDNMVPDAGMMVQRPLHFAVIDEVDSILIDEARTPLIISAAAEESTEMYSTFARLVKKLAEGEDYNIDEKMRAVSITDTGISKMEKSLGIANLYDPGGIELVQHLEQALKAEALFRRDKDYVVKDGEVIIVDEFTGRLMMGRRYSEGLHQAIEAKEGVPVKRESKTLATITLQNYFRLYKKLAGMTGTAATEAEEFSKIYNLEVTAVPTHRPMIRKDLPDLVFKNEKGKFQALVHNIKERHTLGQPVLIGTISIQKNEQMVQLLESSGIPHEVLNAKNHEREAAIIAQAGRKGSVTVATNMAGRGVDIILGGNPPDSKEAEAVRNLGGLHVIGTERHESRRIDNQLRGRSGRQGDPGSTQFFVSLEDDLMRIFGSERIKGMMDSLGVPDDMPIENRMITSALSSAQKKVEGHNFDIRKHLLEYDDIMNKHREVIYKRRKEILEAEDLGQQLLEIIEQEIEHVVSFHTSGEDEAEWNLNEIYERVDTIFSMPVAERIQIEEVRSRAGDKLADANAREVLIKMLIDKAVKAYGAFVKQVEDATKDKNAATKVIRMVMLRTLDTTWIDHLETMQRLREGVALRGYGQRDPLVEYKKEAFELFSQLIGAINSQIAYTIFKVTVSQAPAAVSTPVTAHAHTHTNQTTPAPMTSDSQKVGRNDPCPCGSGLKYKKCGLINAPEHRGTQSVVGG
ncbi:MAG TPA: preprotein translocase subunit SecA [Patescibacteria group bacterium]|nr:preprotein translocase subunit SecA [Patescibacteria group bacterium]